MCPYLSLSCWNTHTVIWSNCRTPWSWCQFYCRPTLISILSTSCCSCTLSAGCCLAVRGQGHFRRILCNIYILLDFYSFICFCTAPYLCGCGPCGMWFYFFVRGGMVIATWTRRRSDGCVAFLLLFVCAAPFVVLGPQCPWSWRRLHSTCCSPTGSVSPPAAAVPKVSAW